MFKILYNQLCKAKDTQNLLLNYGTTMSIRDRKQIVKLWNLLDEALNVAYKLSIKNN